MKRLGVDKTNARIVIITSAAAFLVVFFLVASYSLFGQLTYQNRIIRAKKEAVSTLKKNIKASDSLVDSYKVFVASPENIIGGVANGQGDHDGSNAKLVLDALPSKYDFPAMTASLEKIAADEKVTIQSIAGTDEEVEQAPNESSNNPEPVEMPFQVRLAGGYLEVQGVVDAFQHSIRPIQIETMQLTGDQQNLNLIVSGKTYYQPETSLKLRSKVIR